ncbi:MAG: hypothetical protein GQ564_05155 [Bacteroidales bacterium]|nr:hypothetical protein [Bacteroidales bacterium]
MNTFLNKYKLAIAILFIIAVQKLNANANTKNDLFNTVFKVDFLSMHTWRGFATSYSPTIEPSFEFTTNKSTTGIWLAHSIDGNYSELDLYFTHIWRNFSFTIYDYYCPQTYKESNEITNYYKSTTKHTIELDVEFKGTPKFPITVLVATMIYGDDQNQETNKNIYSTYFQLAYSKTIKKNNFNFALGFNAFESYYGSQFGIVNVGIDMIRNITVFKTKEIPLQSSLLANPLKNSLFLKFGFTL